MNELTDDQIDELQAKRNADYHAGKITDHRSYARTIIAADRAQRQAGQEPVTGDMLQEGLKALLQCAASDIESYSPTLYAGYAADCTRVYCAMLAATPQTAPVPEGYKLAPLEPTAAMLLAGQEAQSQACYRKPQPTGQEWAGVYYRAMLAAAPQPAQRTPDGYTGSNLFSSPNGDGTAVLSMHFDDVAKADAFQAHLAGEAPQPAAQPAVVDSSWISVDERLPDMGVAVLGLIRSAVGVYMRDDSQGDGWLWAQQQDHWNLHGDGFACDDDYEITHWQALPAAPI